MASSGPPPSWLMIVAAFAGLPFTWGVAYFFYQENKQQKTWLRTEAKVTRSEVVERMRKHQKMYKVDLSYAYYVNGQRYESDQIGNTDGLYGSRNVAQRLADRYPAGFGVTVFVDPHQPQVAVLEPGHSWWGITLAFLIGLVWAGAWLAGWYSIYLAPFLRRSGWMR